MIAVGNKLDLEHETKIDQEETEFYFTDKNIDHFYTSAKTGFNVEEAFQTIA